MTQPSPSDRARAERRQAAARTPTGAAPQTPTRLPVGWKLGFAVAALLLGAGLIYFLSTGGPADRAPQSEELDLCRRFMELKNARDPAANDLLGPPPAVPPAAVPPEEADALHAEFFLRGDYRVVSVRPETADVHGPDARFVLVLRGEMSSPRIPQVGPQGTEVINRSMSDPDIVVRVADNKIRAVAARLHKDPNEKRMSEAEQRRFREEVEQQQKRLLEFYQGTGRSDEGKR
jgi:hypothetical protein